jgi:hypothetical protein
LLVWSWPQVVVFLRDLAILDNSLDLGDNGRSEVHLFPYHEVVLVVAIVAVPQLAIGCDFEFHKLMAKFATVAHVVPEKREVKRNVSERMR